MNKILTIDLGDAGWKKKIGKREVDIEWRLDDPTDPARTYVAYGTAWKEEGEVLYSVDHAPNQEDFDAIARHLDDRWNQLMIERSFLKKTNKIHPKISLAASTLGRLGGSKKSAKKTRAAKKNIKKRWSKKK